MSPQKKRVITDHVQALFKEYKINTSPVPVERIARNLGAQIHFSPLDNELSGMIYVKQGTPIIGINSLHHPNRQRFTIAHECGHLLLHKVEISKEIHVDKAFPMLMRDSASATGVNKMEIEANYFAAELLMPVPFLVAALNDEPIDIDDDGVVSRLAKSFKVSPAAMRFRLGNLTV